MPGCGRSSWSSDRQDTNELEASRAVPHTRAVRTPRGVTDGPQPPPLSRAPTALPSARRRLEIRVGPGVVGRVDGQTGRDDLVDAVQHRLIEDDVGRGELGLELLHGARPDEWRGDGGV